MDYKIKKISETNIDLLNQFYKLAFPSRYKSLIKHWKWYYKIGDSNFEPLVLECECFVCKKYSKAYLRHLLINESTSAWLYLTLHNIFQTENILSEVRKSILNSEFENYKESIING